jgi:hypothetical protein
VADALGVRDEAESPPPEATPTGPSLATDAEAERAEVAEAAGQQEDVEAETGFVDTAPVEAIESQFEAPATPVAEPEDDSPYRASLEEPDWLSEDEMGMPSEPPADDRWGSTDAPAGTGRASWSLWDAEPSAALEAEPPATAEPEAGERPSAQPAPTQESTAATHAGEEPVLWLGGPSETDADATADEVNDAAADEGDDAAAEMEVAATGWQSADREGAATARREWRATELPGSSELEDALAALRRMAGRRSDSEEPDGRAAEDPSITPARQTEPESSEAGPAQRAYARLRRILPR